MAGSRRIGELHHVYGIHDGHDWACFPERARIEGIVPDTLLPTADDPGGNLVCIVLRGPNRGAVGFWDHEAGPDPAASVSLLAPDYHAYLRGLAIKVAIVRKRLDLIEAVVPEVGANGIVYSGKTLLDLAFERGSLRMIKMLVSKGANIRPDALIEAVRNTARNTVRYLLWKGIDVNHVIPETGFTALMMAASANSTRLAKLLLQNGGDRKARNRWGKTALQVAHSARMQELLAT